MIGFCVITHSFFLIHLHLLFAPVLGELKEVRHLPSLAACSLVDALIDGWICFIAVYDAGFGCVNNKIVVITQPCRSFSVGAITIPELGQGVADHSDAAEVVSAFQSAEHGLAADDFGSGFVCIIEQWNNLKHSDVAFCGRNDYWLYHNVQLIAVHVELLDATDEIVTGSIDTAGVEPVIDIRIMRNRTNCVFHIEMRRSQYIGLLMISIYLAGNFAVFLQSLRFFDA